MLFFVYYTEGIEELKNLLWEQLKLLIFFSYYFR